MKPQKRFLNLLMVGAMLVNLLALSPLVAPAIAADGAMLRVGFDPDCALHVHASGGELCADRTWIEAFDLPLERERGLEHRDQHLRIGFARLDLSPQAWCGLTLQRQAEPVSLEASLEGFLMRERRLLASARTVLGPLPDWIAQLVLAADSFVFARSLPGGGHGVSVIAGYPWFGDWGRDTMISLPGLALATLLYLPRMAEPFRGHPLLFLVPVGSVLAIANIPRAIHHGRPFYAFISSSATIAAPLSVNRARGRPRF